MRVPKHGMMLTSCRGLMIATVTENRVLLPPLRSSTALHMSSKDLSVEDGPEGNQCNTLRAYQCS
jgi:hypothetical protein